jgi:hypothetical protein
VWSSRKIFAAIWLLAAVVRLTLVFGFHRFEIGRPETIKIAIALATKGEFADPYVIPTGPTAHNPPLYPVLIASFYRVFGDTPAADYGRMAFNTLVASAEYALLPLVSSALGLGLWPGILAGVGGALIPLHLWPECAGEFEQDFTGLILEWSTIWFCRFLRVPSLDPRRAARAGLFCGAAMWMSPNVLPVLVGFGAIAMWRLRPAPAAAARALATFCAAALLVLSPWIIRNYRELGGFVLVRDNFGLELDVSNNDIASPDLTENTGGRYFAAYHPHQSRAAAEEILRIGELAFERRELRRALDWIGTHPARFLQLSAQRVWIFWFPRVPRFRWIYALCSTVSFAGLILLYRQSRLAAGLLATVALGYAAVYAIIENVLRYQHPIWWVEVLLMGWLADQMWRRFKSA